MTKRVKIIVFSVLGTLFLIALSMILFVVLGNTSIHVSKFEVKSDNLPSSFEGFKIAQVSDLHNEEFGKNNKRLLKKLSECEPDIIAITGDLIDSRNTNLEVSLNFVKEAIKIAPCYYVTGNHEGRIDGYEQFENELKSIGVIVLDGTSSMVERNGEKITLYGIHDPESLKGEKYGYAERGIVEKLLKELDYSDTGYNILLSHRPECFAYYVEHKYDLVLTGHAHGGQFRLPFVGGLYAPGQGKFPKYDSGAFIENETTMVVSRGLGNSIFPFRINNTPELVLITLTN